MSLPALRWPLLLVLGALVIGRPIDVAAQAHGGQEPSPSYRVTLLPTVPSQSESMALGLNDLGHVVGLARGNGSFTRAVLWKDGVATVLPSLGGNAEAYAINDAGLIGGSSQRLDGERTETAVVWSEGVLEPVDPGVTDISFARVMDVGADGELAGSVAPRIGGDVRYFRTVGGVGAPLPVPAGAGNASFQIGQPSYAAGRVAGEVLPTSGSGSAPFLFDNGVAQMLPALGALTSRAQDINDAGLVVGSADSPGGINGTVVTVWTNGQPSFLPLPNGVPGPLMGRALAVNDRGDIAGIEGGTGKVFLHRNGETHLLELGVQVFGIHLRLNDRGEIAGSAFVDGRLRAFLASPGGGVRGKVEYERVPVTTSGLDFANITREPVVGVPVQLFRQGSRTPELTTETDEEGEYELERPADSTGRFFVRVLARSAAREISVLRRSEPDEPYQLNSRPFRFPAQGSHTADFLADDRTRTNGPFHILSVLGQAVEFLESAVPGFVPPPTKVQWSSRQRGKSFGFVLGLEPLRVIILTLRGDRRIDSDEFDDDVILACYAEAVLAHARDQQLAGASDLTRLAGRRRSLKPSTALSEAFGLVVAGLVLDTPVLLNSQAGGAVLLNLETGQPLPTPGPFDSLSVASILWEMLHRPEPITGNPISFFDLFFSISQFGGGIEEWDIAMFTRVLGARTFYDDMLLRRGIDPERPYPFPLRPQQPVIESIDGIAIARSGLFGLRDETHDYYIFTSGGTVRVRAQVTGAPTATSTRQTGLLLSVEGQGVEKTVRGLATEELVLTDLPAGRYRVVVQGFVDDRPSRATYVLTADFAPQS